MRTRASALLIALIAVLVVLCAAVPAQAASYQQKLAVTISWTQPSAASHAAWDTARTHRGPWTEYQFDWSTDYCSASPDRPLGYDFRMPCYRHDFGYRNFKDLNVFKAHKAHVDDGFYFDLKQICAAHAGASRQACLKLAWTYYQAVKKLGSLRVTDQEIDAAAAPDPA
jgi:hypothetical protein